MGPIAWDGASCQQPTVPSAQNTLLRLVEYTALWRGQGTALWCSTGCARSASFFFIFSTERQERMSMRDYEVIKELGSGAFGTVVLVKQGSTKYCVKKVDVRRMPPKERDAAVAEARVLKKFNHPNIVQYKDQFIEGGTLCIVVRIYP